MSDFEGRRSFNTLRGFLDGEEPDEPIYFAYSACLRIFGDSLPFDEMTRELQASPTRTHRKGEQRGEHSPPWLEDAWFHEPPLAETDPLERHIDALWSVLRPHVDNLKSLKLRYRVDVFCGYRSNCDHAGIELPHESLEMFIALEIPFGLSIIIA